MKKRPINKKDRIIFIFSCLIAIAILVIVIKTTGYSSVAQSNTTKSNKNDDKLEVVSPSDETSKETKIKDRVQLDVPLLNQMDSPRLYNGCEVTSLAMILNFHGISVSKNQLADKLVSVPVQDSEGYYGNPNKAFVGDITANYGAGYFVYHEPIFNLATEFVNDQFEVIDLTNKSFEEIQRNLSNGNPVWVITTTSFSRNGTNTIWETREGAVSVSMVEHSVVLTGYTEEKIYLNDPYGYKNYETDLEDFIDSWDQMGNQAIVIQ